MKKAVFQAPPLQNDLKRNPDYFPDDIDNIDQIKCTKTISISNRFEPKKVDDGGSGPPTYQAYDVKEISEQIKIQSPYSNVHPELAYFHIANRLGGNLNDSNLVSKAFRSFATVNNASNSTARAFNARTQDCLKSKRLVAATALLAQGTEGVDTNEAVACIRGGYYEGISANYTCPKSDQVYLSDVATFLNQNKNLSLGLEATNPDGTFIPGSCATTPDSHEYFYGEDANCADPTIIPVSLESLTSIPKTKITLTPQQACRLFKTAVEAADVSTSGRKVRLVNKNFITGVDEILNEKIGLPLGNVSGKTDLARLTSTAKTVDAPVDLCNTSASPVSSANRPNPISFIAKVIKFFGTIFKDPETYSDTVEMTWHFDSRISTGIAADNTMLNGLITTKDQAKYTTTNLPDSSDDGKYAIDPGNPQPRVIFSKMFYPLKQQN